MKKAKCTMEDGRTDIIKEDGINGLDDTVVVYRDPDCKKEITSGVLADGDMDWRFSLIMCRFKSLLGLFDDDTYEKYGSIFQAVIKETEKELEDISGFLEKSLGKICLIYDGDYRYENFDDEKVAGLILFPAGTIQSGNVGKREVMP